MNQILIVQKLYVTPEMKKKKKVFKFELFIFDSYEMLDDVVVLRVKREEEFAPVKNADSAGVDCPSTARKLYEKFYGLK